MVRAFAFGRFRAVWLAAIAVATASCFQEDPIVEAGDDSSGGSTTAPSTTMPPGGTTPDPDGTSSGAMSVGMDSSTGAVDSTSDADTGGESTTGEVGCALDSECD